MAYLNVQVIVIVDGCVQCRILTLARFISLLPQKHICNTIFLSKQRKVDQSMK